MRYLNRRTAAAAAESLAPAQASVPPPLRPSAASDLLELTRSQPSHGFCPLREHLIRLQHENKMLKLAQEGSDNEKIALLQSLLEDANRRKSELETENRSEHQPLCGVF